MKIPFHSLLDEAKAIDHAVSAYKSELLTIKNRKRRMKLERIIQEGMKMAMYLRVRNTVNKL